MAGKANIILSDPRLMEAAESEQNSKVAVLLDTMALPKTIGELRAFLATAYRHGFTHGVHVSVERFAELAPDLFEGETHV